MQEMTSAAAPDARAASGPLQAYRYPLEFTGSGSEYFRIWIVNLLMTIATFGIYSAWAKVRRTQYFYRNTRLDGSAFDYHGKPTAILKGRAIALVLILFYNYAFEFSVVLGIVAAAVFAGALPWLLTQSLRFKLHNTSYRGLRFRFTRGARELYLIVGIPLVALLAAGAIFAVAAESEDIEPARLLPVFGVYVILALLWPYLQFRFKRYQHNGSAFGGARGRFRGTAAGFYRIYGVALLLVLATVGIVVLLAFGMGVGVGLSRGDDEPDPRAFFVIGIVAAVAFYAAFFAIGPYVIARVQNYVWNRTLLGLVGFDSRVKARRLIFITVTNLILIVLSLGLFTPFAAVRTYRCRVDAVTVMATGELSGFVAQQGEEVGAAGEGAADLLDLDFAL